MELLLRVQCFVRKNFLIFFSAKKVQDVCQEEVPPSVSHLFPFEWGIKLFLTVAVAVAVEPLPLQLSYTVTIVMVGGSSAGFVTVPTIVQVAITT
jgi:hypothetical protein